MKKILICGGHPTPALAVIDEFKKSKEDVELFFVGRKYAIETERTLSYEYKACQERSVRFLELQAGRITRALSKSSILNIFRVPLGFAQALLILLHEEPSIIVSFGGYIALPIAFWGWILKKRVITHEQTMCPGNANKIIGFFSQKIYVAFEETLQYFPRAKTKWIGNPVREVVFEKGRLPYEIPNDLPLVYVTGGSLGSHSINEHIFHILPNLLSICSIIHQTGDVKEYGDFDTATRLKRKLSHTHKGIYIPIKHVSESEIGPLYDKVDCVVARSGANTFFELVALKKPAILIPLPWSANGEQKAHAQFFVKHEIGILFDQKETSEALLAVIRQMLTKLTLYKNNFSKLPLELKDDAAKTIVLESLR